MKLMIASDIHGSAYYCRLMLDRFTWSCVESGKAADAESRGYSAERTHTYTGM